MSEAKIDEFPCLFSASRVIGVSETGSLETASSSGESANFRPLSGRRYPAAARSARPRLALDAARFEFLVQQPDLAKKRQLALGMGVGELCQEEPRNRRDNTGTGQRKPGLQRSQRMASSVDTYAGGT